MIWVIIAMVTMFMLIILLLGLGSILRLDELHEELDDTLYNQDDKFTDTI